MFGYMISAALSRNETLIEEMTERRGLPAI